MKRAIITGATGSVGTALIETLIRNNVEVLVFSRKESKRNSNIPVHPLVSIFDCDLASLANVENTTGKEYDVFFHFAWDGTYGETRNELKKQVNNIEYEIDAIRAAKKFGCKCFVGAGSQAEYGRVEGVIRPDTPCFPENGYGIAKLAAGVFGAMECDKLGIRHCWVRIVSVYGKYDNKDSLVIKALDCFENGDGGSFTPGGQLWDYLSARDAGDAFYAVAEKGINGKTYVLASGQSRPLRQYIEDIANVVGYCGIIGFGKVPYSPKQVMNLQADISDIERDTGWKPSYKFKDEIRIIIESRKGALK